MATFAAMAVVWALSGWGPAAPAKASVTIDQLAFGPAEVHAVAGDTVEWVNHDAIVHTATARDGSWKVIIQPGKKASVLLKRAGRFEYYCEYHPNMTGVVIVAKKR
jgi:plastocyanin